MMNNLSVQSTLVTSLETIKKEVVAFVKRNGLATQDQIIDSLHWPSVMITMAIGTLIRDEVVLAKNIRGDIVLYKSGFQLKEVSPVVIREFEGEPSPVGAK